MTLPPSGTPAAQQVFGNEKAVKFNILPTGTTLGAGFANASNDPVTHNTFSADQKLYGPLHVTTAVTDVGQVDQQQKRYRRLQTELVGWLPNTTTRFCKSRA